MERNPREAMEKEMDTVIGNILRTGVIAAAVLVLLGGIIYLAANAHNTVSYHTFGAAAAYSHNLAGIMAKAMVFNSYGIIQLGLLILIATPIARVLFSVVAFAIQRDFVYVVFTVIVLGILLYSLVWHGMK